MEQKQKQAEMTLDELDELEVLTPHQKMLHDHREAKRRRREWHRDFRRKTRAKYAGNLY